MALITAKPGDLGEKAIIVGNLQRMNTVSSLLEDSKLVSEFAGYYTYVGVWASLNFHELVSNPQPLDFTRVTGKPVTPPPL
jgi:Uridine phosphorylase